MTNLHSVLVVITISLFCFKSAWARDISGLEISPEHEKPKYKEVEEKHTFYNNIAEEKTLKRIRRDLTQKKFDEEQFIYDLLPDEYTIVNDLWSSWILPVTQDRVKTVNIGNYTVYGLSMYGGFTGWSGIIKTEHVLPGQTVIYGDFLKVKETGMQFVNNEKGRVLFFAAREHDHPTKFSHQKPLAKIPFLEFDHISVKHLLQLATYIGGKSAFTDHYNMMLSITMNYWPDNSLAKWESILREISSFLSQSVVEQITGKLKKVLNPVEKQIRNVLDLVKENSCLEMDYIRLVEKLDMLVEELVFSTDYHNYKEINYYTLPLYSHFVNLANTIYLYGIGYQEELDLTDRDVSILAQKLNILTETATIYIENMNADRFQHTYNIGVANYIFDELMNVRTYMEVNGLAYLSFWKYAKNPTYSTIDYTTLAYSEYFGRSTVSLYMTSLHNISLLQPEIIPVDREYAPIGATREKLQSLRVYLGWDNHDTIIKIETSYDDRPEIKHNDSPHIKVVDLTGRTIKKMEVGGDGMLDYMVLTLSDGDYIEIGKNIRKNNKVFQLKHHHITAIFAGNDCRNVSATQLCNIAVSFALDEVEYLED